MSGALLAILAVSGLFVLFGSLRSADRRGCGGGCAGCTNECEHHVEEGDS